jgi:hypothetical protein
MIRPLVAALTFLVACGGETSPRGSRVDGGGQGGEASSEITAADGESVDADDGESVDAGGREFECDDHLVTCGAPRPICPPFQESVVSDGCWAGYCVTGWACRNAGDCAACAESQVCAIDTFESGFRRSRCEEIPPECIADRTCNCLARHICKGYLASCGDPGNGRVFGCFCLC